MGKSFKCSKGCHKYNKTTDEIYEAAAKHKDTALILKEVSEKQKKKIEVYKQQTENLEFEVRDQQKENDAVKRSNSDLKKEIVILEKILRTKQTELDQNEEDFRAENEKLTERVVRLCRMNEKHFKDISQFCWDLEEERKVTIEKNKEIEVLGKKKGLSDRIIKNLQHEKEKLKEELNAVNLAKEQTQSEIDAFRSKVEKNDAEVSAKNEEHVQKLLKEIEEIQNENFIKQAQIEEVVKEIEMCREGHTKLEIENKELKEDIEKKPASSEEIKSLGAELGLVDLNYVCDICDNSFGNFDQLRSHKVEKHYKESTQAWKAKGDALEKQMLEQRLEISSGILKLKEKETLDAHRCCCKRFCRIFHKKHNWKASLSRKFAEKLEFM